MFRMSDGKHFQKANRQLYYKMNNDPSYRASLEEKFPGIFEKVSPGKRGALLRTAPTGSGWETTWHHHERVGGLLQLVDWPDHNSRHLDYDPKGYGGRKTWGGLDADNCEGIMNTYTSIDELIASLSQLEPGEWIYTNINTWEARPEDTHFFYISWDYIQSLEDDEIYLDEEDLEMPLAVETFSLKGWMLVSSLNYIVKNKNSGGHGNKWFIDEVNYYRENGTYRT